MMTSIFKMRPIGRVCRSNDSTSIKVDARFTDALLGIEEFSHLMVFYWFHQNDRVSKRSTLQVHPRGNPDNPLCGVFATHAPVRPNLIAFSVCQLIRVADNELHIDQIDARDGSPVVDLKCYIPFGPDPSSIRLPDWV